MRRSLVAAGIGVVAATWLGIIGTASGAGGLVTGTMIDLTATAY